MSFLTLYSGWRFIHSEKFSREASMKVSGLLTKKAGAKLSFAGVKFSLFPLSTTFKNVKIYKNDREDFNIAIEADELEVAFTYSSFISSDLEIDEFSLKNGFIHIFSYKKNAPEIILRNLNTREIFIKYTEALTGIPVHLNLFSIEKIKLKIDNFSMDVNKLTFSPQRLKARLKGDVSNVIIAHEKKDFPQVELSNIQFLGIMQRDEWRINELKIQHKENELNMNGVAFNENNILNFNSKGSFKFKADRGLSTLKFLPKDIQSIEGEVEGGFSSTGAIDAPDGVVTFNAKNVITDWINLEKINGIVSKNKNFIIANKMSAVNGDELYLLKKAETFFDLKKEKFTNFNFNLQLKNAYTDTFFKSLKDSLGTLKGSLSGDVDVSLFEDKALFTIKDKIQIADFRLTSDDGKKDILKNAGFSLDNSLITINHDFSVNVDAKVLMPNSRIQAKGKISEKGIDISITDSTIDMKSFGPISGVSIEGAGPVAVKVSGPLDNVVFDFNVDWNNLSFVDLYFGKVKADFSLDLKKLVLDIRSLDGVYNKSNYAASGVLGFDGETEGMDITIDFKNSNFSDARKMLNLVFKDLKLPVIPEFDFSSKYSIKGGFDLESLKVEGQIRGSDLKIAGEEAEKINLDLSLSNSLLALRKIKINKSRGELNSNININLNNNYVELSGSTKNLRLRDFNFYRELRLEYDGDLGLDFDGSGTTEDFTSRFKTKVTNTFIGNMPASSSSAIFYINSNDIVTTGSLLGGKIKVDSLLSYKSGIASIKASVDTNDLRELLGVFSSHNMADKGISGNVKAQVNMQVSTGSLGVRKFLLNFDQLNFEKGDVRLAVEPNFNRIQVEDGIVKKWDLRLRDGKEYILSSGRNISNGVIALEHRFALKASLLEIISEQIERATGVIKGSDLIVLDKKLNVKKFNLYGENHSLKIKGLPGFITNLNYNITKKGEDFDVIKIGGGYGEGKFNIAGKITFDDMYPEVALSYQVERSTIPLFKRSGVLINMNGTITGTSLPYKLNGKVLFMHGEILDDPADLMKDDKVTIDGYKKYLPEKSFLGNKEIVALNLSFDVLNPVVVKNNMAEVYIKGSGLVTGDIQSPELNIRLETIPNISKFKFKGHDFALNQGYFEIRDHGKNRISDLKFTGVAKISDYDMKLDLSGSTSKVNIDLSSEPALSKDDLLSLLTLGVTSDMSKNLDAGERRFVTTVGIGTLLVDQLKINEDLNATLGVKLSVQPEFKEDETTLIAGKSAVSEGSTSRLKSATKIKINKKISNKIDVSLSSTIGGSLEQKQEMNINLKINKNFSLEGVYEVKPTEEESTTTTPNSLGADLKWRRSF